MKTFVVTVLSLLGSNFPLMATPMDDVEMSKGTVLNYTVKDGKVSYKIKATILVWNPELSVQVQWQTSGSKVTRGITVFSRGALASATKLKVKLKAGSEKLGAGMIRWFAGFDTYDDLYNLGIDADIEIDDKQLTLTPDDEETTKEIMYNNVNTEWNYTGATNSDDDHPVRVGFIEYATNVILISNYSSGNFSFELVSIQNPAASAKAKAKPEEEFAKKILEGMAPKGTVPLKKMEPAKFAKVKAKYPLLSTIESYDATHGGSVKKPITETYEYRYGSNSPNPPSLVDCFTVDLKIIYKQASNFGISEIETVGGRSLSAKAAKTLMDVYLNKDYNTIPGYRPWTNWSFVRSLTESQRTQLAAELEGYIAEYGFSE